MSEWATEDNYDECDLRELIDSIRAREAREALEARDRAREKATREALEASEKATREVRTRREQLYRQDDAAADMWVAEMAAVGQQVASVPTTPVAPLRRHAVDLACEEPLVDLQWVTKKSRLEACVGEDNALAIIAQRVVMTLPIVDARTYVVCLHEIGHLRSPLSRTYSFRK